MHSHTTIDAQSAKECLPILNDTTPTPCPTSRPCLTRVSTHRAKQEENVPRLSHGVNKLSCSMLRKTARPMESQGSNI
jgi:hypothetical protein